MPVHAAVDWQAQQRQAPRDHTSGGHKLNDHGTTVICHARLHVIDANAVLPVDSVAAIGAGISRCAWPARSPWLSIAAGRDKQRRFGLPFRGHSLQPLSDCLCHKAWQQFSDTLCSPLLYERLDGRLINIATIAPRGAVFAVHAVGAIFSVTAWGTVLAVDAVGSVAAIATWFASRPGGSVLPIQAVGAVLAITARRAVFPGWPCITALATRPRKAVCAALTGRTVSALFAARSRGAILSVDAALALRPRRTVTAVTPWIALFAALAGWTALTRRAIATSNSIGTTLAGWSHRPTFTGCAILASRPLWPNRASLSYWSMRAGLATFSGRASRPRLTALTLGAIQALFALLATLTLRARISTIAFRSRRADVSARALITRGTFFADRPSLSAFANRTAVTLLAFQVDRYARAPSLQCFQALADRRKAAPQPYIHGRHDATLLLFVHWGVLSVWERVAIKARDEQQQHVVLFDALAAQ